MFIHKTAKILIVIIIFVKFYHIKLNEATLSFLKPRYDGFIFNYLLQNKIQLKLLLLPLS